MTIIGYWYTIVYYTYMYWMKTMHAHHKRSFPNIRKHDPMDDYYYSTTLQQRENQKPHYAPIRIQYVNVLVNKGKYNEFSIIHNKQITLYVFHKSRVLSFNNSKKCMIKIFLESAIMW